MGGKEKSAYTLVSFGGCRSYLTTGEADVHGAAVVTGLVVGDHVLVLFDPVRDEIAENAGAMSMNDENRVFAVLHLILEEELEARLRDVVT